MLPARQHIPFRRQPATTSRHHSFHTGPTILNQPTPSSQLGRPTPSTSSVLLPLLQPAGQTRNVVSRAGAACKAADGAGEEPAFLFFLFFYFFLLLSFLSSFPSPWRRGFAATPSFFFLLLFFFLFFLFDFLLFFLLFSFCFFLFIFLLIFYSCFFFVLSFCFFFLFTFALIFVFCFLFLFLFFFLVFIFASLFFFVILFVLLFYPPRSNLFPYYPTARQPFIFFSSAANLSHSLQPLLGSSKKKKISAKESTGVRWPPGSERAAE